MLVFFVSDRELQLVSSVASDRGLPYLFSLLATENYHICFRC